MRDARTMADLFARGLDNVDAGFGIDALRLTAPVTEALPVQQITTDGAAGADDLADLLTRLTNRLGFEHVLRLLPADSHIPEKAAIIAPAAYSEAHGHWPATRLRPIDLFDPEPLQGARGPQPPRAFRWRGQDWQVTGVNGPERITPEWWLDDPAWRTGLRDYWCVQTAQGARLWLFHVPTTDGWSVQGMFA
jgi:protein ImuB